MLADVVDKWKSPIYQLSVLAILAQVIGQFLVCIGLDFVISPSFLGLASLGVSLCNQITMICVNIAALMLIYTFFKTQKLIFAGCLTVSVDAIVESVFICMTSVVFIRHIIQKLELPPWEVAREIVLKYGGLKFLMLIGIRFFGAGLIFKLMASGFVADNISNMANCNLIDCRHEYHPSVLGHLYHPSDCLLCNKELDGERQRHSNERLCNQK
ncbi:hypothetical protein EDD86DRAFT_210797, partial [Gorgonomyces haynaldii]